MKTEEKSEKINRILGIISAVIGIVGSIFGIFQAQHTTKNHNHTPFACHCDKVGGPLFFCFIHIILSVVHRAWWSSGGRAAYSWGSCW